MIALCYIVFQTINSVLFHHRLCSVFFVKLIMVSVQNLYQLCHKPPRLLVYDNEFIAKTINEGNIDLTQYPAAKV